ncbi:MAG: leucine-rich repeat protein [Clostridia bacterium]|nr:leucine-rich repeat protein [Clostridia bacterium]
MSTKVVAKPVSAVIAVMLAAIILAVSLPFASMAAVDDFIEDGSLIYLVTSEDDGSGYGTVTVGFNEDVDPENVTSIKIPDTVTYGDNVYVVTEIAENAFSVCSSLASLDISECYDLTTIGQGAFYECAKLKSISVPCDFDMSVLKGSGIVPTEDGYYVEGFVMVVGEVISMTTEPLVYGEFTYCHSWEVNDKNYAEHKCSICGEKASHSWQPDKNNASQHICTVCKYTEAHYGTADCNGNAKCSACSAEFKTEKGSHAWNVIAETIGTTTAEYACSACTTTKEESIGIGENEAEFEGQRIRMILQDPYKCLPEGVRLSATPIQAGAARYNELKAKLDDEVHDKSLAFFELELYQANGEQISGAIPGRVRILIQIPDGWEKSDIEIALIMDGQDLEFEESIITIDGVDYVAFWTNHFSPYAMMKVTNSETRSPETGSPEYTLIPAYILAASPAILIGFAVYKKKKRI